MIYTRAVAVSATSAQLAAASHMQLTDNFTLAEFYVHEIPPANVESDKLPAMALIAQWFRDLVGGPVAVTSYYRSSDHNAEVGGAPASPHQTGDGIDLTPNPSIDYATIVAPAVLAAIESGEAQPFGQMIFYKDQGHVHIAADGMPNGQHFQLLFSDTPEEGTPRSYSAFSTLEEFAALWGISLPGASSGLAVIALVFFSSFFSRMTI